MTNRSLRAILLVALAVAVTAGAVWFAADAQRNAANHAAAQVRSAEDMLTAMLDEDTAIRGFSLTIDHGALKSYTSARKRFTATLAHARDEAGGDPSALAAVGAEAALAARWQSAATQAIATARRRGAGHPDVAETLKRKSIIDTFRATNLRLQSLLSARGESEQNRARFVAVLLIVILAAFFALVGYFTVIRPTRREAGRRDEEDGYRRTQTQFTNLMLATRSEFEAQNLLRRQVQRTIPDSSVVVLELNDNTDRLDAVTTVAENTELADRLIDATSASCLAVRMARAHREGAGTDSLVECELCGKAAAGSTCAPLLVGGDVIGSVLVQHEGDLSPLQVRRLDDSIHQAAPVLANLRNLARVESRASTDSLTGLPNRRALEDTMKRMLAHADRSVSGMSVIAMDLDHFKQINDVYGHEAGDAVLAAVGQVLASSVRASDFVARYGGEEFIVLAADTDAQTALAIADKLRRALNVVELPDDGGPVTGSFGVASFPEHGGDADMLMRAADRALYTAKERGRNRVELGGSKIADAWY